MTVMESWTSVFVIVACLVWVATMSVVALDALEDWRQAREKDR